MWLIFEEIVDTILFRHYSEFTQFFFFFFFVLWFYSFFFFNLFIFYWIFSLFTFRMLSAFPPPPPRPPIPSSLPLLLWGCSSTHSPTPTSLPSIPLHWGIYQAFIGPRTSPPIDASQGHHLLHMQLEPCVLLGWWLSPWKLWGYSWLVFLFFLWGCKPLQLLQPFL